MVKYSFELKEKIVNEYLSGNCGFGSLSKKYNIDVKGQGSIIHRWVHAYKTLGDNGLMRSRKKRNYTFAFKMHVIELYISTEVSYLDLALSLGIKHPSIIGNWLSAYRSGGPDALRSQEEGLNETMKSSNRKTGASSTSKTVPADANAERLKELEAEILKLRIELAFLKELRRLRLEDEARQRERQESTKDSKDSME